ncbi:Acetoin utilization deacetylase AcuC [Abditibacterium utsteinense]|uniref:Acetoin utilization deacetylase AcuC n=1 Tax=Abditibacterium utsteinense TaxID=1960156 RepID=A0A2S8STX6_9BACT|nr:histone deacetylase [Abditibacterium utsteinense]PQV64251.1 Acetoin utilization deacetylase AcuC [Abditibacterium utsteinense]
MKTAFLIHPLFLQHDTGPAHPERPARLMAIEKQLRATALWDELTHLGFSPASELDVERCHTKNHIARVKGIAQSGGGALDADTILSLRSFDAALLASGATMRATEAVWHGEVENAFVAARPCGHHAESGRNAHSPWGFCLFNHAAVAARYAQQKLGAKKIAILDFDVHHGNGTQEIFWEDDTVFFASLHEAPLFPGSGAASETGAPNACGLTLNIPLRAGADGTIYRAAWQKVGIEVKKFAPDLILLSAGYDAYQNDPLAHMNLRVEDFAALVADAKSWADSLCSGKIVAVLEGGYNLDGLARSVEATLRVLSGKAN